MSPGVDRARRLATAETLMLMALALLDRAGGTAMTAARLQHAIDTLAADRASPDEELSCQVS